LNLACPDKEDNLIRKLFSQGHLTILAQHDVHRSAPFVTVCETVIYYAALWHKPIIFGTMQVHDEERAWSLTPS
jgi:hypothetical protein